MGGQVDDRKALEQAGGPVHIDDGGDPAHRVKARPQHDYFLHNSSLQVKAAAQTVLRRLGTDGAAILPSYLGNKMTAV
ncbi:hypothetical protein RugamoR64_54340 [Duganella rhizosphaerae]